MPEIPAIKGFQGEYRFLSNFWFVPHRVFTYPTVEHYFQAMKTVDLDDRRRIRAMATPAQAKRAGRQVLLRPDWPEIHLDVMYRGLEEKFAPGTELAQQLLDTGDLYLEETNTWGDTYWGVCRGVGHNYLGTLLMARRRRLKEA